MSGAEGKGEGIMRQPARQKKEALAAFVGPPLRLARHWKKSGERTNMPAFEPRTKKPTQPLIPYR